MIAEPQSAGAPPARAEERDPVPEPEPERLSRNRDFLLVLFGQGISSFGDAISNTAMPILVLALTGSGFAMGVVGVLSTLPDLLVGLPAGAFADRWNRRTMMFWADLGRAVLTALVPVSVALGGPTLAIVMLVAFPLNVLRVLWLAAYTAAVPGLVGRSQVPRANGVFEAVFNVGWIVGPALAGLLAAAIGPGPTIAIDAATFLVSAGALLLVKRNLVPDRRGEPTHVLADIREGVRFVWGEATLRAVIALWTVTQVVMAGLTPALIFFITVDRGLGTEVVGVVLSAFALGSLGGSVLAARLAPRRTGAVMLLGTVVNGVVLAASAVAPTPVLVAGALLAGVVNANILVAYISLRTLLSPDALLGRVGATARTLSVGLMPLGSLAAGIALDVVGGGPTLLAMGGLLLATAGLFALLPAVRSARISG